MSYVDREEANLRMHLRGNQCRAAGRAVQGAGKFSSNRPHSQRWLLWDAKCMQFTESIVKGCDWQWLSLLQEWRADCWSLKLQRHELDQLNAHVSRSRYRQTSEPEDALIAACASRASWTGAQAELLMSVLRTATLQRNAQDATRNTFPQQRLLINCHIHLLPGNFFDAISCPHTPGHYERIGEALVLRYSVRFRSTQTQLLHGLQIMTIIRV
jgi:hypothetical protein